MLTRDGSGRTPAGPLHAWTGRVGYQKGGVGSLGIDAPSFGPAGPSSLIALGAAQKLLS